MTIVVPGYNTLPAAAAVSFKGGINYRRTVEHGPGPDGPDDTFGAMAHLYPHAYSTANGEAWDGGWDVTPAGDWNNTGMTDIRLAGNNSLLNSAVPNLWQRWDLPGPGTYRVWVGIGSTVGTSINVEIFDGIQGQSPVSRYSYEQSMNSNRWMHVTGLESTTPAGWTAAYATEYVDVLINSGVASLHFSFAAGSTASHISHVHLELQ